MGLGEITGGIALGNASSWQAEGTVAILLLDRVVMGSRVGSSSGDFQSPLIRKWAVSNRPSLAFPRHPRTKNQALRF